MAKSKIKSILHSLNEENLQNLTSSIQVEPLKLSKDAAKIWLDIISHKDHKVDIDRSSINRRLFQNKPSDSRIRNLLSEIYHKIELWIVIQQAMEDQAYKQSILLKYYRNKGIDKLFQSTLRHSRQSEDLLSGNSETLSYHYNLLMEEYNYASTQSRTSNFNLQELLDHVDIEFSAKKLRQACFAAAHTNISGQSYDFGLLDSIIANIESKGLKHIPAIGIYLHALGMIRQPEDDIHYKSFQNLLKVCESHFPTHEMRSLYLLSINHCVKKINQGHLDFGDEILKLYNTGIDKKYLLLDGHLSRYTYSNVATVSLKLGKSEWAIDFSEKYKPYLRQEERKATYHFNLAKIKYHIGDLDNALVSLQYVDFSDHLFSLKAKTLQLKIYYETESYKSLYSHLDAMQMYLLRKKVIGYHKTNYKNLIRYTKLLVKCNKLDRGEKAALKGKVNAEKILTDRKWFLEKLK